MSKILIIEDDSVMGQMLSLYLDGEGFTVHRTETAESGLKTITDFQPEVILLDLILPDSDGIDLCHRFRQLTRIPIVVVSMKNEVIDRVNALKSGADDFLSKPFSMQELKARIEALLRRSEDVHQHVKVQDVAVKPNKPEKFMFDYERRLLVVNEVKVDLTFSEWELMKLFHSAPGKVFVREELINAVRGIDSFVNDRSIDVHIMNLRKKIKENSKKPRHIKTVWKLGYKFEMD